MSEITIVEVPAVNVAPPVQTVPVPVNVIVRELAASVPAVKVTEMADQLSCNVQPPPEPLKTTVPKLFEAPVMVKPVVVAANVRVPVYEERTLVESVRFP